jgi:hypothetical protein
MASRRPYKAYLYQSSNMLEDNQFYLVTEIYLNARSFVEFSYKVSKLNQILSDFHYAESFYSVVNLGDIYYRET